MGFGVGSEMCSATKIGWILLKGVFFILASFVFSVVFWATKHWLDKKPGKKKK
ncbi:hypothetical protein ACFL96_03010 [Thermoproteota archaeon]